MNERMCTGGHALYILYTLVKYDEVMSYVREGYKQQHILETIGELKRKEMWEKKGMDVVINLSIQSNDRIEKKAKSYRNMGIQYWEMVTSLAHLMDSTGERERNMLLGLPPSKHFKSTHLTQIQTILNEKRRRG